MSVRDFPKAPCFDNAGGNQGRLDEKTKQT